MSKTESPALRDIIVQRRGKILNNYTNKYKITNLYHHYEGKEHNALRKNRIVLNCIQIRKDFTEDMEFKVVSEEYIGVNQVKTNE